MPIPRHRLYCLVGLVLLATLAASETSAQRGAEPGRFDYYVLVLGWTPSYCATEGKRRRDRQCETERPHAFTLHGLWPQNVEGWPEDCRMRKRPWVPQSVIDDIRDIMPSKNLIIHEYRAHGTCSGLEPAQYFGLARDLYERVGIPPRFSARPRASSNRKRHRGRVPQVKCVAEAEHDRGELPRTEPARRAHLLRPRPLSEAVRIERGAAGLPRRRDQRAGGKTALSVSGN